MFALGEELPGVIVSVTSEQHVHGAVNFQRVGACAVHGLPQFVGHKHGNTQWMQSTGLRLPSHDDCGVEAFCHAREDASSSQRHADAFSEPVKQIALDLKHVGEISPVCRNRVEVDIETRHGSGVAFAALAAFAPPSHAL